MGKHFDSLVEIVNKQLIKRDVRIEHQKQNIRLQEYLKQVMDQTALFEFPIGPGQLKERIMKEKGSYVQYLKEHFKLSEEYNQMLIRPFEITAIEDPNAVNIMVPTKKDEFRLINYSKIDDFIPPMPDINSQFGLPVLGSKGPFGQSVSKSIRAILIGDIHIMPLFVKGIEDKAAIGFKTDIKYKGVWLGNKFISKRSPNHPLSDHPVFEILKLFQDEACSIDLDKSTLSYIQSVVYIMDPANFIVERESKASRNYTRTEQEKPECRRDKKIRKTAMRPHYIMTDEKGVGRIADAQPGRKKKPHIVRGHIRKFNSDYYVNKKGKTIYVAQFMSPKESFMDSKGNVYCVYLKKSPTELEPIGKTEQQKK